MKTSTAPLPCDLADHSRGAVQSARLSRSHGGPLSRAWRSWRWLPLATMLLLATQAAFGQQQFGWLQASPVTSPGPKSNLTMAYDEARKQIVLFCAGPSTNDGIGITSQTWVWDGYTWIQKFPANAPLWRYGQAMAYDAAHGNVVMFSGVVPRG